ncbi:MAG: hypothetical protein KJ958_04530 [Gammaproteobacteria bacterium]|nr:hypothetical protein [Gammaproteobacteria bacterium]MBU1978419.1 hypothetical protein [Gammaproteobacteria bacterium]
MKNSIVEFKYPDELKRSPSTESWRSKYPEIDKINADILNSIKDKAGVYAILTARQNESWQLRYIGQAKATVSKQRIRSHLVWRNRETKSGKFTGSKFDEVRLNLSSRYDVALSFVEVTPESLRHYVEEVLIKRMHPDWNQNGTTASGQKSNCRDCSW